MFLLYFYIEISFEISTNIRIEFCKTMKRLEEMLLENMLIMESNTLRFPKKSEPSKFKLFTSEHCDQRMQERHVSEKELLDAVFGAYKDLNAKYKEKKLKQSYNGEDSRCVIVDARKNKNKPVCVVLFLRHSLQNCIQGRRLHRCNSCKRH
jgi:hypothetical protein